VTKIVSLREVFAVHVAQRDHLHAANLERSFYIHHAIPTAADEAELEFAGRLGSAQDGGKLAQRQSADGRGLEKMASARCLHELNMQKYYLESRSKIAISCPVDHLPATAQQGGSHHSQPMQGVVGRSAFSLGGTGSGHATGTSSLCWPGEPAILSGPSSDFRDPFAALSGRLQTSASSGSDTTPRSTPAFANYLRRQAALGQDSNPAR
jgi:hypothetical protein